MKVSDRTGKLANKIQKECDSIDSKRVEEFLKLIQKADRIFVHGMGRSSLVAKAFAMRLMHLGFSAYVVGETITPAAGMGDLLVAVSGSGETASVVAIAELARFKGLEVVALTSFKLSQLGKIADCSLIICEGKGGERIAPLGTLFELSCMVFLDAVAEELRVRCGKSERSMKEMHSDLE